MFAFVTHSWSAVGHGVAYLFRIPEETIQEPRSLLTPRREGVGTVRHVSRYQHGWDSDVC